MRKQIPTQENNFNQTNISDRNGNLWRTKNISFMEQNYLKLEDRLRSFTDGSTLTDLDFSAGSGVFDISFDIGGTDIWLLGTKNIYKSDYATEPLTFTKDTDTSFPTLSANGDTAALEYSNDMYVASDNILSKKVGSTWSTIAAVTNATTLCIFTNLNQLAIGGGQTVVTLNTSDVVQTTLTLPDDYSVTKMAWSNHRMYIATVSTKGRNAILFEWDGLSTSAQAGYEISGHSIYSVVPYKSGVAVVTSAGKLLYNSGGWQELARFPIFSKKVVWESTASDNNINRKICSNGMVVFEDVIYIGVNALVDVGGNCNSPRFYQDFPSGVWSYDPQEGLVHRFSLDGSLSLRTNAITTGNVDATTNIITVAGVTVSETGTPVFYYNSASSAIETSSATPLKHGQRYYTIKLSGTTLKLATSYANAIAGTAIDITATGNNNQYLIFTPKDQIGGIRNYVTCLSLLDSDISNRKPTSVISRLMVGGVAYKSDTTTATFIASVVTDQENRGYFISQKFESDNVEDMWQRMTTKFKPLIYPEDKIIIKYRPIGNTLPDYETFNLVNVGVTLWVDSDTYTTTNDISTIKTRADAGIYDEVEIIAGKGSGYTAHITSITESGGTYTVNLDETIPGVTAGDKLRPVYSNWIKLDEINTSTPSNEAGYAETAISDASSDIQTKTELRGFDVTILKQEIVSQTEKASDVYNG